MPMSYAPQGAEACVNATRTGFQQFPAIAALPDGGYVVAWVSFTGDITSVCGQRFDADGAPVGAEFLISDAVAVAEQPPAIAAFEGGGFIVSWTTAGPAGDVLARIYGADGSESAAFAVTNDIAGSQSQPTVTAAGESAFLCWVTWPPGAAEGLVLGRVFDASGAAVSDETTIGIATSPDASPSVTALAGGGFALSWATDSNADGLADVAVQLLAADGAPVGNAIQVAGASAPAIAALQGGGFVLLWVGSGGEIVAQIFNPAGNATGELVAVNLMTAGEQSNPFVTALDGGGFICGWESAGQDGSGWGVYMREFDAGGASVTGELLVNSSVVGDQRNGAAARLEGGQYVIAWNDGAPDVLSQLFGTSNAATSSADILRGSAAGESINGGGGNDHVYGLDGSDYLIGSAGDDRLSGGRGNDRLNGGTGADLLMGGAGNDSLDGSSGADTMIGGAGDDRYYVNDPGDLVFECAGEGNDLLRSSISFTLPENVERLILAGPSDLVGIGNALDNIIWGSAGNNILNGGAGADTMRGGAGDDTYHVNDRGDRVVEARNSGTDVIRSSIPLTLPPNVENLVLTGSGGINAFGNTLANTMYGNAGDNRLEGGAGDDLLAGADGRDLLLGSVGADDLRGGNGDDWLEGGAGADILTGGAGADTFAFRDGDFGGSTVAAADRIRDFAPADGDRIRLNYVDANRLADEDQRFTFIGTDGFHDRAGELRYEQVGGNTFIYGDTDGDGIADFAIQLDGLHTLVSGDFVL